MYLTYVSYEDNGSAIPGVATGSTASAAAGATVSEAAGSTASEAAHLQLCDFIDNPVLRRLVLIRPGQC